MAASPVKREGDDNMHAEIEFGPLVRLLCENQRKTGFAPQNRHVAMEIG